MRLLALNDDGGFSLVTFAGSNIPCYAILSHTWGSENEEVTFKDIVDGSGTDKAGYEKLRFCGNQAKVDGLFYFWIDTCCIDKSNNTELTEAINSMFQWYQNAARCYVYLTDVSVRTDDGHVPHIQWEFALRGSRWFTRGWTLQELLAPKIIEFYSQEHVRIGDKISLEREIHEITGIPVEALRGSNLQDFSVQKRFQWVERRQTTKEEDMAYCLLGIFNIFLPLIYGEGRANARRRLVREIQDLESENNKMRVFDKTPLRNMPFDRNLRFTGRESELSKLETLLFKDGQVAVTGLGGVGKTQLAIELVYRTMEKRKDCSVFWISATDPESLLQAYLTVAEQLSLVGRDEAGANVKRLVQNYLSDESVGPWLLVFDNADDMDMWMKRSASEPAPGRLLDYLPKSRQGQIIFTTRDRKVAVKLAPKNLVEVREMNSEAATELLQKCLVGHDLVAESNATEALLTELTYLPLAIIQASAYIKANGVSIAEYLSLLYKQDKSTIELLSEDFEDVDRYENIKNQIATTWLISFERIQQLDPLAAEYLSFMACIEPKDIPRALLPKVISLKREMDAIGTLDAYSFITRRDAGRVLDLHRLVHLATRNWLMEKGLIREWATRTIKRLIQMLPTVTYDTKALWRICLPHVRYALYSNEVDNYSSHYMNLASSFGLCLSDDGRYDEAEKVLLEVLKRDRIVMGPEHQDTIRSMGNLGSAYMQQGRWKDAEKLDTQVMEICLKVYGKEHQQTLVSIANLASTYMKQGRWKEAEELDKQVLETRKKVLGEDHRDMLSSTAALASTQFEKGNWKEAEELDIQILKTRKEMLGEEHPDTIASETCLAWTYLKQGRWKEAEDLFVKAVEMRKKILGEEHPDALASRADLATIHMKQGRWKKAEELYTEVIELRKKVLGEEHPDTLTNIANLALVYTHQERWDLAERIQVKDLQFCKKNFGDEHPETLKSMAYLATTYSKQGRSIEAENLGRQAMESSKRICGAEHPDTLTSMNYLNTIYRDQKQWEKAEELGRQTMKSCTTVLGVKHPDTLMSMDNLARTWKETGRKRAAVELMKECVELRKQVMGVDHPYTLKSSKSLAEWELEEEDTTMSG